MKHPDPSSSDAADPLEPERLLRSKLRATTPGFESRFDDMRRRLAQQPARPGWLRLWAQLIGGHPATAFAVAAVAVALVVVFGLARFEPRSKTLTAEQVERFGAMAELDDALRVALPLTDREVLEAILLMPVESTEG